MCLLLKFLYFTLNYRVLFQRPSSTESRLKMAWERGCELQGNLVCSHLVCIYLPLALVSFSAINYITYYIISLITDKVFKNNAFRKPRGKCKNGVRLLDHLKLKFGHRWQSKLITIKLNSNKNGKTERGFARGFSKSFRNCFW